MVVDHQIAEAASGRLKGDVGVRRAAARRRVWLAYVAKFNEIRIDSEVDVPEMGDRLKNEGEELISAYLVDCGADIEAGEAVLMHVLAVGEAEARRTKSLDWFGERMWTKAAIDARKNRQTKATELPSNRRTGNGAPQRGLSTGDILEIANEMDRRGMR